MRKKAKYGYARDRFGRLLERDRYKEDNFFIEDNGQSLYDSEDDNGNYWLED
jgi:hypothetical protein